MERLVAGIILIVSLWLLFKLSQIKHPVHVIYGTILSKNIVQSNTRMSTVLIKVTERGITSKMTLIFDTRNIHCRHAEGEECFHGGAVELSKILLCGTEITVTSHKIVDGTEKTVHVFKLIFPYLK